MPLFDEKVKEQLKEIFSKLNNPIKIHLFTQEFECPACSMTHQFVQEIASLSDKIQYFVHDFQKDKATCESFSIDKIPALVVTDNNNNIKGVRFFGLPAGYEINSFIAATLEISGVKENLSLQLKQRIKKINKKVHIQVFVTLTCPYCPAAVATAHKLAIENPNITADMIESSTFPPLSIKYNVSSVPKIIINEKYDFVGAQPIEKFLETIERIE